MTRRDFLGTASAGMIAAATTGRAFVGAAMGATTLPPQTTFSKTRILRVFIGGPHPSWPNPHLDLNAEATRVGAGIDGVAGLDDVEFVSNQLVTNPGNLLRLLEQHKDVDGVLAVPLCIGTSHSIGILAESGYPSVLFALPYSGHEWCIVPDLQRQNKKIDVIPTSDFNDVMAAIRPLRAIHRLKETKLLFMGGGWSPPDAYLTEVQNKLGVVIEPIEHTVVNEVYDSIDAAQADAEADRWMGEAEAIKEPPRTEIVKASRYYLALRKVLADRGAYAVTINCLGLFGRQQLPAYPCLAFARLNDIGMAGVCESDVASALTQIIYQHMEGVPGFVTDPVFDTANNALIHAHCVSATKMDGPAGPACPYVMRTHLEDDKGVSLQVKMRIGQEVTMAKLVGPDRRSPDTNPYLSATPIESLGASTMLVSTGEIIDVPDVDRGCRTKITTRVRDARKMFEGWAHGLHRVIFYGNHMADTHRLARLVGIDVIEEG